MKLQKSRDHTFEDPWRSYKHTLSKKIDATLWNRIKLIRTELHCPLGLKCKYGKVSNSLIVISPMNIRKSIHLDSHLMLRNYWINNQYYNAGSHALTPSRIRISSVLSPSAFEGGFTILHSNASAARTLKQAIANPARNLSRKVSLYTTRICVRYTTGTARLYSVAHA